MSASLSQLHPLQRLDNRLDINDCEIIDNDYQIKYRPLLIEYLKDKQGRTKLSVEEIQTVLHNELFWYEAEWLVWHPSVFRDVHDPDAFDEEGEYEGGIDIASAESLLQYFVQHLAHREFFSSTACLEAKGIVPPGTF